jgi:tetratricopeptide (TPR) repeat protein
MTPGERAHAPSGSKWTSFPRSAPIAAFRTNRIMSRNFNSEVEGGRVRSPNRATRTLEFSLRPASRAVFLMAPLVVFGVWMSWEGFRASRAVHQLDDISIPHSEKALQEDPTNADLIHHLGSLYYTDPTEANPALAVKYLREAVSLNPRRWDYWMDLGVACDAASDLACSDHAFAQAEALNSQTPAIMWSVGNHYLLTDRPEKAFPAFRHLLDLDSQYLIMVYRLCFRATRDPQAIYDGIAADAPNPSIRFSYLQFLCSLADYEGAMKIWAEMISGPDPQPDPALVKPFLDLLMDHSQIDDAQEVWGDLQRASVIPPNPPPDAPNILYNSGFDRPPLNTGFDWHVSDSPDLDFDLADPTGYAGGKCVRIEFPVGRDAEYYLLSQVVRVQPNTRYQFSAQVRSDSLTSQSGPRLRADEIACADCAVRTSDPTVGSTSWHQVDLEFTTERQTQALRVSFWRPKEQNFSRDITGTVWLGELTLHAVETPRSAARQEMPR